MSFVDSLNENDIKRRRLKKQQEEKEQEINRFICDFENYVKRKCTVIAERGGKKFFGYLAYDSDEFGKCLVIHAFAKGELCTVSNWVCGLGTDKRYVDDICKKMSYILINLGFKHFSVDAKWTMLQTIKNYKPMFSNYTKSKIVDDHEEYTIYVEICW